MNRKTLISKAKSARTESKDLDFKAAFDPGILGDWCELLKDIAAMTNSGGGAIVFGVSNNARPSGADLSSISTLDPATITNKIAVYTGSQFGDFELVQIRRGKGRVMALFIEGAHSPIVFIRPGEYEYELDGVMKKKTAFQKGTLYFRHGTKSEPAHPGDIEQFIMREVQRHRESWLRNIRRVAEISPDQIMSVHVSDGKSGAGSTAKLSRIVSTKTAPGVYPTNADSIWKYRAKDVIKRVNDRLNGKGVMGRHDILTIRNVHQIQEKHPDFAYRPFAHLPTQYSEKFIEWIVKSFNSDKNFFAITKEKYKMITKAKKR